MSAVPYRALAAIPAVSTYLLVAHKPDLLLSSRPTYLGTYVQLFIIELITWAFWAVLLYPRFFSPLRHLPMPAGGSWWNGQRQTIAENPSGKPMIEW